MATLTEEVRRPSSHASRSFCDGVESSTLSKPRKCGKLANGVRGALQRAWCAFEFYLAHELGKPFYVNSKEGPLQLLQKPSKETQVWVEHLFGMLQVHATF